MTRINCIPVKELTGKHLIAEYRELPRVFRLARHPHNNETFPHKYVLGKGHVKFFYNKLQFCYQRQHQLYNEMKRRGYHPQLIPLDLFFKWQAEKPDLWGDWEPTDEALYLNRKRIKERLNK